MEARSENGRKSGSGEVKLSHRAPLEKLGLIERVRSFLAKQNLQMAEQLQSTKGCETGKKTLLRNIMTGNKVVLPSLRI